MTMTDTETETAAKGKTIPARTTPMQPGDWLALGLADGRCPVGEILATDDTWVSLRLKSFGTGYLTNTIEIVRWADVRRAEAAYPEDAELTAYGPAMDDDHLGQLQTGWTQAHAPDGDPVRAACHAFNLEMR